MQDSAAGTALIFYMKKEVQAHINNEDEQKKSSKLFGYISWKFTFKSLSLTGLENFWKYYILFEV